jgi:NADPH:quinone reductase-like Zn-dependent oxidoreductase
VAIPDFKVGEELFGICSAGQEGTYWEHIAMQAGLCAKKPSNISHVDICALALISITTIAVLE